MHFSPLPRHDNCEPISRVGFYLCDRWWRELQELISWSVRNNRQCRYRISLILPLAVKRCDETNHLLSLFHQISWVCSWNKFSCEHICRARINWLVGMPLLVEPGCADVVCRRALTEVSLWYMLVCRLLLLSLNIRTSRNSTTSRLHFIVSLMLRLFILRTSVKAWSSCYVPCQIARTSSI